MDKMRSIGLTIGYKQDGINKPPLPCKAMQESCLLPTVQIICVDLISAGHFMLGRRCVAFQRALQN